MSVPLLPHLRPLSVAWEEYVGDIRKALEKGYSEHPGLNTALTTRLRFSSVLDDACVACCLFLPTTTCDVFTVLGPAPTYRFDAEKRGTEICAF